MPTFPNLSNKEAFILSYLLQNQKGYGLEMVKSSDGLLERNTIYITLKRMTDKGYLRSWSEEKGEGEVGPPRRVYEATGAGATAFNQWIALAQSLALKPVVR